MDAIIVFLLLNNDCIQNLSNQSSFLSKRAIFDPIDPHFDHWGTQKWVIIRDMDKMDAVIVFRLLNND